MSGQYEAGVDSEYSLNNAYSLGQTPGEISLLLDKRGGTVRLYRQSKRRQRNGLYQGQHGCSSKPAL